MKKLVPYVLASAIALPSFAFGAAQVSAQTAAPTQAQDCHGEGRRGGPGGHGHHGPRGHRGDHGHRDPARFVEHRATMMTAILNLDARQQAEVRRILTAEATEMATLHQQPRGDARHQAVRALHERTKASIAALLSPSQRATMDRIDSVRQAERARREAERPARPAPGAPGATAPAPAPTR